MTRKEAIELARRYEGLAGEHLRAERCAVGWVIIVGQSTSPVGGSRLLVDERSGERRWYPAWPISRIEHVHMGRPRPAKRR